MEEYKKSFINFMVDSHVLKFGEFTLKSGRKSPFFMNAGAYKTGSQLIKLGEFYAKAINDKFGLEFDVLFGPAYKGIPLAVATVMAISKLYGRDIKYCCNRKEIKDHGDKGILLGAKLSDEDRVMIIEDVTTSGASIAETVPIIRAQADVDIVGHGRSAGVPVQQADRRESADRQKDQEGVGSVLCRIRRQESLRKNRNNDRRLCCPGGTAEPD